MKQFFLLMFLIGATIAAGAQVTSVAASVVEQRIKEKEVVVLDVRTAAEYREGHLPGAQLLDVLQRTEFVNTVKQLLRNKTYIVYCHSGRRSLDAARLMEELGFRSVINMKEGILGWKGSLTKK